MKFYNIMKKTGVAALGLLLAAGLSACGFHIGGSGDPDDYKSVFTDRTAELGSTYKAAQLAYVFSLEKYGSMMVHVDTTDGHSFEVVPDSAEFVIKDSDGNTVIHAYFMDKEAYAVLTAESDEIKTVNGRDFVYSKDQAYYHMFSYMADCGIDLGMVLESDVDESVFRLVAFRGDALDGASSDVYAYKGKSTDYESDVDFDKDDEETDNSANDRDDENTDLGNAGSLVNSTLSDDAEMKIKSLDADYSKINWGARYSAGEDAPYVVISIAPYEFYGQYYLLIGVTNLYDEDISFSGKAEAIGNGDEILGDTYLYASAIGHGNTVFSEICCGDEMPDGRLRWSECEISDEVYGDYVLWQADYKMSGDPKEEMVSMDYHINGVEDKTMTPGYVTFLLLDENGNIMAKGEDYIDEEIAVGETYEGKMKVYGEEKLLKQVKDVAMFVESVN